ncbi:MAG: hypothetical protein JW969_01185 [Spirochaetales bacterium]|nr:hypothetical protein [Spirochaetales bacterium]
MVTSLDGYGNAFAAFSGEEPTQETSKSIGITHFIKYPEIKLIKMLTMVNISIMIQIHTPVDKQGPEGDTENLVPVKTGEIK